MKALNERVATDRVEQPLNSGQTSLKSGMIGHSLLPPRHENLQINTQSSPDNTDICRVTDSNDGMAPAMTVNTPYLGSKENLDSSDIE